jgi:hypothetical protein
MSSLIDKDQQTMRPQPAQAQRALVVGQLLFLISIRLPITVRTAIETGISVFVKISGELP